MKSLTQRKSLNKVEHNGIPKSLVIRPELLQWHHTDQAVGITKIQNTPRLISHVRANNEYTLYAQFAHNYEFTSTGIQR